MGRSTIEAFQDRPQYLFHHLLDNAPGNYDTAPESPHFHQAGSFCVLECGFKNTRSGGGMGNSCRAGNRRDYR